MPKTKKTNEMEFQGRAAVWLCELIKIRRYTMLEVATTEKPGETNAKRNDLVVWKNRAALDAFLTIELKTPETPIHDPVFFNDALSKAKRWGAPFFCLWNMQRAELYLTPGPDAAPPASPISSVNTTEPIKSVEDWLVPDKESSLKNALWEIAESAILHSFDGSAHFAVEAEVFAARLEHTIREVRVAIYKELHKATAASKALRKKINAIAASQGFAGFVDDVDFAVAGQLSYRIVGQILFYYALRRKNSSLPELQVDSKLALLPQLRVFWDLVRRFDYEALYGADEVETLVALPKLAERRIIALIDALSHYDWASLADDVLGTVFERLIPREEQILLGQFYTPKPVADLLVALVIDGESPLVLDPGCGSGTFLMSAYDYLAREQKKQHSEILPRLWGFDLSSLATELAAINLYRQDFTSFANFPRIVPGSFFDRAVGEKVKFPPAKPAAAGAPKKLEIPIPLFDAIVANPPYLRSQNQDDLDPKYRSVLFASAAKAGIAAPQKTDLFAFFFFHASRFLAEGGCAGFVTPTSWLSADYGTVLQDFLMSGLRLRLIVTSEAEPLFSQVEVNTALVVAQKATTLEDASPVRFVSIKKPLADLFPFDGKYWDRLLDFACEIEGVENDYDSDAYRVKLVHTESNHQGVKSLADDRNWSKYLRGPLSYFKLFPNA